MHSLGILRPRAWLTLLMEIPQTKKAGATWLCKSQPYSSTDLHISPELHKVATASAHQFSKGVDDVLIHFFGQLGVEDYVTLSTSKKQCNKCSRLQFKGFNFSSLPELSGTVILPLFTL